MYLDHYSIGYSARCSAAAVSASEALAQVIVLNDWLFLLMVAQQFPTILCIRSAHYIFSYTIFSEKNQIYESECDYLADSGTCQKANSPASFSALLVNVL